MTRRSPATVALAALAVLLAGCAGSPPATDPDEPVAEATVTPSGARMGDVEGIVGDQTIHPLGGVTVTLRGFNVSVQTRDDGTFAFRNLAPGAYLLEARKEGFAVAQATADVTAGDRAKVGFLLERLPDRTPYAESVKWDAFVELRAGPFLGVSADTWFRFDRNPGVHTLVLESAWDPAAVPGPEGDRLQYTVESWNQRPREEYLRGEAPNPMRLAFDVRPLGLNDALRIDVEPYGSSIHFEASGTTIASMWYHGPPPEGWSAA